MKKALTFVFCVAFAISSNAQKEYLLLPADTPGTVKINTGVALKHITQQKVKVNQIKKFDGYRIEIYQGNDRKIAKEILEKFKAENPSIPAVMVFETPHVKVKVGIFRSKLEAQPLYFNLKDEYVGSKLVFSKGISFPPLNAKKEEKEERILKQPHVEDF